MPHRSALAVVPALLIALTPSTARACSLAGFPMARSPHGVHLIATATPDTVLAGPGDVRYRIDDGHFGPAGTRTVYGQVLDVERIGGPAAHRLARSVRQVLVVPWDYGADCGTTLWTRSARWVKPGEGGLILATLRDSAHWVAGMPTLDMRAPGSNPYTGGQSFRKGEAAPLSVREYFDFLDLLPVATGEDVAAEEEYKALLDWADAQPAQARRYPASAVIDVALYEIRYERVRRAEIPLAGTYRLTIRLDDGPSRTFFLRTEPRARSPWDPRPHAARDRTSPAGAEPMGYTLGAFTALTENDIPGDCRSREGRFGSEGVLSALLAPEQRNGSRVWRGSIDANLLTLQFQADSALQRFQQDHLEEFYGRSLRGEGEMPAARFTLDADGQLRVEQTLPPERRPGAPAQRHADLAANARGLRARPAVPAAR